MWQDARLEKSAICLRFYLFCLGPLVLSVLSTVTAAERDFTVSVEVVTQPDQAVALSAAAAYDSKRGRMLVFGGIDAEKNQASSIVRALDPAAREWATLDTREPCPDAVAKPALIYDPKGDALYLFGGWARGAEKPSAALWMLPLSGEGRGTWKLLSKNDKGAPGRNGLVMVLDAARNRLLIHGGDGGPHPKYGFTPLNDLWSYDIGEASWHRLTPKGDVPEPRWAHAGVADDEAGKMFIFGGAGYVGEKQVVDDCVFELDMATLVWKKHTGQGTHPPPVEDASLTYDAVADMLILVGGVSLADTGKPGAKSVWLFDLKSLRWREYPDLLRELRRGHTAVYDQRGKRHVISGGEEAQERGNFYTRGRPIHDIALISVAPK